ncbi:hypothetical protein K439DRAFT_1353264, partial [Ramaria rubella]
FQIWKIQITAELRDKKMWGLVDGSDINTGPNMTIYPSYYQGTDSWEVRDGKAHSIIVKHMSNSLIFKHVTSPQTSKALWESVISQFKNQNTSISAFYTYVEIMNTKWDEFMAFILLHSLPTTPKFKTLITTILNSIQSNNTISFSKVESHLMARDIYNKGEENTTAIVQPSNGESANKSTCFKTDNNSKFKQCSVHGKCNHEMKDCNTLKQERKREWRRKDKGKHKKEKKKRKCANQASSPGSEVIVTMTQIHPVLLVMRRIQLTSQIDL